ncbi:nuclear transport factor 2 family protein [Nonomuraea typhae]|uniref:Nuclear transport factor 2 family protein n=1 Tax=Nonomuraea typhae TaxID=2603600 RepID=A0ABW7YNY2_9ACTN
MTAHNPVVAAFIAAINNGDRSAFAATLAPGATMSDDGSDRDLDNWTEREIFSAGGRFTVETQEPDGLTMLARFRNDTWGEMKTRWRFILTPDGSKIRRFETGQA